MKVVLDPGHSGPIEPGAVGPKGVTEAEVVLAIANFTAAELIRRGHDVILTRTGPIDNDDLSWRAEIANDWDADLFISIHANAAANEAAVGFEGFTTPGDTGSDAACEMVLAEIARTFPEMDTRFDYSDGDADKEANFTVISKTACPSMLIETAFISNAGEETMLATPELQQAYGEAIARGADAYLRSR